MMMTDTTKFITPYSLEVELGMQHFYESLSEKDKRRYSAIEASKLGHGGILYIAELFDCARQTVSAGLEELKKKSF
jgi:hypothetical protein